MNKEGYSDKSLIEKLGYQLGDQVYLKNAPEQLSKCLIEAGVGITVKLPATWLQGFFSSKREFTKFLQNVNLKQVDKGLWLSWPKKSSGLQTDLNEQTFRDFILSLGWVDVKVAAIDETWSGLKFLRRKN